jgi:hypothetical protein
MKLGCASAMGWSKKKEGLPTLGENPSLKKISYEENYF